MKFMPYGQILNFVNIISINIDALRAIYYVGNLQSFIVVCKSHYTFYIPSLCGWQASTILHKNPFVNFRNQWVDKKYSIKIIKYRVLF